MKRHIELGLAGLFCWLLAYTVDPDNYTAIFMLLVLAGIALICPAVWVYGWRLIGIAIRVARVEVEKK